MRSWFYFPMKNMVCHAAAVLISASLDSNSRPRSHSRYSSWNARANMVVAARALAEAGGGQCVVSGGDVKALLPLPIAGLMSDQSPEVVIEQQDTLLRAAHALGCPHHDPFMPLSFLPLPVIPHLKLSDLGLVDVDQFKVVPLTV